MPVAVTASDAAPWLERLARLGFAVKGALYLTIGILSARAAVGAGGHTVTDPHDAMGVLGGVGWPVLAVIAVGLAGYGSWLAISAITDADHCGRDAKGIAKRIGAASRGIVHLALAGTAVSLLLWQRGGASNDAHARHWTARVLDTPGGVAIVWIAALSIGSYGCYQLFCAWTSKLDERLDVRNRVLIAISRFGIAARGLVFITVAVLFARAALSRNAAEAGGPGDSLRELFSFGTWPSAAIAIGLAAYGVYQLIEARYRRIRGC